MTTGLSLNFFFLLPVNVSHFLDYLPAVLDSWGPRSPLLSRPMIKYLGLTISDTREFLNVKWEVLSL